MKNILTLGFTPILLGAILLVGAGCTPTDSTPNPTPGSAMTKPADDGSMMDDSAMMEDTESDDVMMDDGSTVADGTITLEAEGGGKGLAKLRWEVAEGTDVSDGFMLVRSEKPNPIHDTKNYWWRQHEKSREGTWIDVPRGTHHIRVCILRDAECASYSNDVEVTVE